MNDRHLCPTARVVTCYEAIAAEDRPEVWITLRDKTDLLVEAREIEQRMAEGEVLPLAGLLVAVKDNIDVAGLPTTAGCPEFSYTPEITAVAVARLVDAGALVVGKTNLDQFATGLVGTRSPYGAVRNAHFPELVSGGSSSGSAVAVALGLVDLGIGTDTAGSGRVPAALNGIVGLKTTCGIIPTHAVLPACVDYDAVTVFAADLELAVTASSIMAGVDKLDPRSRNWPADVILAAPEAPTIAIPEPTNLLSLETEYREAFDRSVSAAADSGIKIETLDISVFLDAARLLYDGAIVAERYAAVGEFLDSAPEHVDPTVKSIISAAANKTGHDFAADLDAIVHARAAAKEILSNYDALLLPTTTEHPSITAVQADPITINRRMGTFTNFINLLDLAAVAVPGQSLESGRPFGVMFVVPAFADQVAIDIAAKFSAVAAPLLIHSGVDLAVFGAHLRGQPLHWELERHGARYVRDIRTNDSYRLSALNTTPPKPGLIRTDAGQGAEISGELYRISEAGLGRFLAALPAPMALTSIELDNGSHVIGFTATHDAVRDATDITELRSWKQYLKQRSPADTAEP